MGEAKRKKQLSAANADKALQLQPELLGAAVRQVVRACTDFHGADCLLFAAIGAGALRLLGIEATPVAGSAIWRLGPGDSDTISHARELAGPLFMQAVSLQAMQFHAWVQAPGLLADFSTCTLKLKAQQLDAADGGTTRVDWAPDLLWLPGALPPAHLLTPQAVNQSFDTGVYCYIRHQDIERKVLTDVPQMLEDLGSAIAATVTAYRALCAGHVLQVAGVGKDGVQSEPVMRGLTAVPVAR